MSSTSFILGQKNFQPAKADRLSGRILAHEACAEVADVLEGKITAIIVHRAVHEMIAVLDHLGEDFAFFAQMVPGLYYTTGSRSPEIPEEKSIPLHNNACSPDEKAMLTGTNVMVAGAIAFLNK